MGVLEVQNETRSLGWSEKGNFGLIKLLRSAILLISVEHENGYCVLLVGQLNSGFESAANQHVEWLYSTTSHCCTRLMLVHQCKAYRR